LRPTFQPWIWTFLPPSWDPKLIQLNSETAVIEAELLHWRLLCTAGETVVRNAYQKEGSKTVIYTHYLMERFGVKGITCFKIDGQHE